jgi:hypothetical protein
MSKTKHLEDAYRFPGFHPLRWVKGIFGDPWARLLTLRRQEKKPSVELAVRFTDPTTITGCGKSATCPAAVSASTWNWKHAVSSVANAAP